MAQIIFEQFDGGLQRGWSGLSTSARAFKNQNPNGLLGLSNPFIHEGAFCPAIGSRTSVANESQITGSTNNIRSIIAVHDDVIDTSNDASVYFGQDDDFHAMTLTGTVQTSSWPKTLSMAGAHSGHTGGTIDKIVDYQINGARRQLAFFRDNTDWDAASWDGSTFTTTGLSGVTGYSASQININYPILAITSDNGMCYFGNRNLLHKYNGSSTNAITGSVLSLSANREMVDLVDGFGKVWILTRPATASGQFGTAGWPFLDGDFQSEISVVVWGRNSTLVNTDDNIPVDGCVDAYAIYFYDGVPYIWTKAPTGVNQLRAYDGKKFRIVAELGKNLIGIPAVNNGGAIGQYMNGFVWQDREGYVYYHGIINPLNSDQKTTHVIAVPYTSITGNSGGAIWVGSSSDSTRIYTTGVISSAVKLHYFIPDSDSETDAGQIVYTVAKELPKLSTIDGVTIFFKENTSDDTGTSTLKVFNSWAKSSGDYVRTKYIDHDVDIPRGWVYFPVAMPNSNLVQISIQTSGGKALSKLPQITRIQVDYTPQAKLK